MKYKIEFFIDTGEEHIHSDLEGNEFTSEKQCHNYIIDNKLLECSEYVVVCAYYETLE